ncbi:tetratricopeptide repeat protein [Brevibacillus borstelensis]|uniref:tetratricopeptide repeat protein n=1 Tax=Brevibacillus borstelensis TaxID=45462 RepID=UPI001D0B1A1C|nr:tetratricopeptide repeat protein [Brevibacillus borstelensis]MCC0564340.1 tetratricopeptide repeat protein [Brevibacillus borstelensis]MCM3472382.1 tetratricopeptide repeat protein [Brevibacillus borstelensis]MCM3559422.1 tetratricopeptide repeat protein [Brevibacillus borstelensis]MCM3591897.1 tetratricopeptide repeat protein [Brevibacillus borstelensis]MCM3622735.1 tetratricopeptide repeat protein [Brevibacillus borstelensis]
MSLIRDDNNVAWQEAMHLYHMGRYEQAKEKFMPFLATSQEDGQLLFFVAYCSFKLDQLDEAETFAREALRVGYFGEEVYSLLGIICKAKGAYAEAEEFFLAGLAKNPQDGDLLAQYGYLMLVTGYEEKAKLLMAEAMRVDPESEVVLHYHYHFLRAYDEVEAQQETIRKYNEIAGSDVDKLLKMGLAALDRGNYREARECYRQAYLLDPGNEPLLYAIEEIDEIIHPVFFTNRLMQKTGGPVVWWICFIGAVFLFGKLDWEGAAGVLAMVYVPFCIYTWISPFIYRAVRKWGRYR